METKKFREKVAQCRKKTKRGPFTLTRFCRLRLKSEKPKGTLWRQKKFSKKSRTVPKKIQKPFSPVRFCRLRLKSKKPKGDSLETKIGFEKKSNSAEKNPKNPLVPSGFVGYV